MTNKEYIKILQSLQDWLYLCSMNGGARLQREAIDKAIEALSQPQEQIKDLAEVGTDCISRQAAIDIERNATVDTNPSHFEAHQKFTQFMDDAEISSFGRWQWSNGFNTALTAVGIDLKKLPSAQPELMHCGECKHYVFIDDRIDRFPIRGCSLTGFNDVDTDDFCSRAERRER